MPLVYHVSKKDIEFQNEFLYLALSATIFSDKNFLPLFNKNKADRSKHVNLFRLLKAVSIDSNPLGNIPEFYHFYRFSSSLDQRWILAHSPDKIPLAA